MNAIDWLFDILREYPTLALFLTVGLGFLLGKLRIGNFSLGSVTSVLLVGVIVGQIGIPMSGPVKTVFFMMFLFSIGYSVGPDFFKSLKGAGAKQALFAVLMSSVSFISVFCVAKFMGYGKGETVGLFAGSQTCSALLGVGGEALHRFGLSPQDLRQQLDIIPVCYAVCYIFGTLGTVILLGNLGPSLLGGREKVKKLTSELEKKLSRSDRSKDPSYQNALNKTAYRAYEVSDPYFASSPTVRQVERHLSEHGLEVYIDRLEREGDIIAPRYDEPIKAGDRVVVCGRSESIINVGRYIGAETADPNLLSYPLDRVGVVVSRRDFAGRKLSEIRKERYMHGVVIRDAWHNGKPMAIDCDTVFGKGDRLTVVGRPVQVKKAASHMGHMDRPSIATDIMFVGLAIFVGGLMGTLSIVVDSIPVSFGTSGGALISGLVFGWLRSRRPTFGYISPGALWIMNNLGLNVFIAVVGIEAGPSFVSGIQSVGPMLFVAGAVATLIPLCFGLFMGHKVFKFNPAITLGCVCGTRTCTAALGAVQTALGSTLPAIGYTVTYAVANIMLVIWGILTVLLV